MSRKRVSFIVGDDKGEMPDSPIVNGHKSPGKAVPGDIEDEDLASLDGGQLTNDFSSQLSINMGAQQVDAVQLVPHAPDGGYGWVIVFAAFMSNFVVDGISTAFSEFKPSYKQAFGASDAMTSLIGSLIIGTYLLVGPMVGGLCNKYEPRYVVMLGAVICGIAFLISTAAPNIYIFMLIYGVLGGIGFGMIYLPAIVVVGFYFESKRAMATGIAVAGSGVGTFVMPLICNWAIQTIGWQYTLWLLAAFCFSCLAYGLLYRPLPMIDPNELREQEMEPLRQALSKMSDGDEEEVSSNNVESPQVNRAASAQSNGDNNSSDDDPTKDPNLIRLRHECEQEEAPQSPADSHKTRAHTATRSRKHTMTSMGSDSQHDLKSSRGNLAENRLSRVSARSFAQSLSKLSKAGGASNLSIAMSGVDPQEFARPMNRQDVFYGGSITNLKEYKQEGNMSNFRASTLSIPRSVIGQAASHMNLSRAGSRLGGSHLGGANGVVEEEDYIDDYVDDGKCQWIPLSIRNAFAQMIDLELLKDPVMILLCISNLLGMMGFYIPFMFLKDLATEMELDSNKASLLVPIIGVTNTVGRVFFGWVADKKYMTALTINNLSLVICGFLTLACPLLTSYSGQLFYSFFFGFIISAYICLTSIVLADLMGLEKLTNSFGLLVVARGIASLAGAPFAGLVYDITKSYGAAFYFGGFVILISGLISCAIPFVLKRQQKRAAEEGDDLSKFQDLDNISGKLSVLTERSEENLTEYQRTIQSLRQQYALLQDLEEEKRKQKQNGVVEEVNEEEADETVPLKVLKQNE
ncbi:unnamed protein product [Caenorhabditis angaria]|uniref:Major facilitator superfamily (MFS) profile domain-containing protein n=1 Tax=Caenorhabditis angaria TaxID=860376 RepID=A0A9P1J576_9PELO|nr:unnamed protein product [Caenorhabditis angaria]